MHPEPLLPDPFERARKRIQAGDMEGAQRLTRAGLALQPGSARGLTVAGHLAVRRSAAHEALRHFGRAMLADSSGDPRPTLNLVRAQELAGNPGEALATARRAVARFPGDAGARGVLALLQAQAGAHAEAVAALRPGDMARLDGSTAYKLAMAMRSAVEFRDTVIALLRRALGAGGPFLNDALTAYILYAPAKDPIRFDAARRRLVLAPDAVDAMDAADECLGHQRKLVRQAAWRWQASRLMPQDAARLERAAALLFDVKWPDHGVAAHRELLRRRPWDHRLVDRMAQLLGRKGDRDAALQWGRQLLATNPGDPRILDAVAGLYKSVEAFDEAEDLWPQILRRHPQYEALHYNYALFLDHRGRFDEAERQCRKALVLKPDYLRGANQLSMLVSRGDRLAAALRYVSWPLKVDPAYANGYVNQGIYLRTVGAYGPAIEAFRRAEQHAAGDAHLEASGRFNAGMSKILIGEIEDGFNLLESRWATNEFTSPKRSFRQRIWPGPHVQPNSRLLLYMEQGMGDEVMLSWYFPLLRRDTRRLVVDCDERLVPLFARTYEGIEFVPRSREGDPRAHAPGLDFKVPAFHLPQFYAPEVKFLIRANWDWAERRGTRFPARLVIESNRLSRWRDWLEREFPGQPRIALSWRSKIRNRTRDTQYLTIEELARAIPAGCVAINLQYSSTEEEIAQLSELGRQRGFDVVTPEGVDLTNDLEDVLAILHGVDAAVTPLISLAWMAGAVGCPGYIFRCAAEGVIWHQFGTPFIPWAPSLRVFFRHPREAWDHTIADLRARLEGFLAGTGSADRPA